MSNKKRHHHYVWRYYLKPWLSDNKIHCLRDNKIFSTNPMGIGQKKDFYKLRELTAGDLDFIEKLAIEPAQGHLKSLHINFLNNYQAVFKFKKLIEVNNIDDPDINQELDIAIHNLEEDLHCAVEDVGKKYLQLLYRKDTSFWNNEDDVMHFTYFLSVQYMRTQKRKESLLSQLNGNLLDRGERIWNLLAQIFATNVAWSFYRDRSTCSLTLLENDTAVNFITGDQPCINIMADPNPTDTPPERITLYYPVTPKLAILLQDEASTCSTLNLGQKEVEKYNTLIQANSYEQLYGLSANDLKPFQE